MIWATVLLVLQLCCFILGIKETILNMLLSYNSLWLRIGIEVSGVSYIELINIL